MSNNRKLNGINKIVNDILSLESSYSSMSDDELKGKTAEFKQRISSGESLDSILPEAFATVREASWRVLGMKHFPVQLMGGITLHQGKIAEMKTGEGKTIVSTCPAYLNALSGNGGVFVVTVNDYLAKRDSQQMGKVYNFLGLSTGLITHEMSPFERKLAYMQDIVYITNNELGFDYLRDRMAYSLDGMVQKDFNYCIVDEIDSILIDEARTPLIISGFNGESDEGYKLANEFVRNLRGKKVVEKDNNKLEQMSYQMLGKEMIDEYADFDYIVE